VAPSRRLAQVRGQLSRFELRRRVRLLRRLSKRDLLLGRRVVRLNGALLEIPPERGWAYADGTYWEKDVLPYLKRAAATVEDAVFYDVGANCGHYTVALAPSVGTVFAFEPVEKTFAVLQRNVKRNNLSNVELLRLALGDETGKTTFYLYGSSGLSSSIKGPVSAESEEQVCIAKLDALFEAGRLPPPDVIKIDTEGGELFVLRGARTLLKKALPILLLEFHAVQAQIAGYDLGDIRRELGALAYTLFDLDGYPTPLAADEALKGRVLALPPGRNL
jgi:FkbM family methyltransferase